MIGKTCFNLVRCRTLHWKILATPLEIISGKSLKTLVMTLRNIELLLWNLKPIIDDLVPAERLCIIIVIFCMLKRVIFVTTFIIVVV